jgi:hypothetical protein
MHSSSLSSKYNVAMPNKRKPPAKPGSLGLATLIDIVDGEEEYAVDLVIDERRARWGPKIPIFGQVNGIAPTWTLVTWRIQQH